MVTLMHIKLHTFIKKLYFLSLDAKIPPNIWFDRKLGTSGLRKLHKNRMPCTLAPFYIQGGV